ncbi:hypothetical protein ACF0H5_019593 [Mactra antiquata]
MKSKNHSSKMSSVNVLLFGLVVLLSVHKTDAIRCYQCSDAADNKYSDCIRGTYALSIERADHEKRNKSIHKLPHLKDCGQYRDKFTGRPKYEYCKVEIIKAHGYVNAFIRDCSDGRDFSKDLKMNRLEFGTYVTPDNQSTCGYSHGHLANICVQICSGDFCNGPFAGQNALTSSTTLIGLMITILLWRYLLFH